MQQRFLPDIYEELQDRVRLRQQKGKQLQQQQQEAWGEEEVFEVAGLPAAVQPAAKPLEELPPMEAGSEALLMEVSFAPLDLDVAFQRFAGAKCLLGEGLDDDLRQLYRQPKVDTTRLLEAGGKKESPRSRLARLRAEVPDAIRFIEELCDHAEKEKAFEEESVASASGAAYVLSLSQTLSKAAAGLSTAVRERVAADVELQQVLFTGGQQQQQQLSLLGQEETGGLVAPLFCPSSCVEMDQLARDVRVWLGFRVFVPLQDAAQLAGAGRAEAARRLLQLESRLNRLERVCLAATAAEGTQEQEVCALAQQWAADPQAPSLAELASRLDNLLTLAADPTPLSLLASHLSVVRCCLDEQEQQQHQQEHHKQQQRLRWEDERGALEDNEFSEFLPENIVLSLHRKLMPCKGIAEGLPRTTEALNRAKTSYAEVVSLVEAMTALGTQQQTLKEKQLQLGIHETETDALLESYEFTFGYAGRRPDISVSRKEGDGKITSEPGGQKPVSKAEAKKQTEAVLQSLCAITQQLEPLPANSYVSLRTPPNYAPKGFASKIDNVSFGGEVPFTAISDKIDTAYHTLKISIQSLADPPQIMPIITEGERRAVMRIVDEVKAYVLSTGETDVQKLTRILGKSCEPFIATATSQLLASGLLAPEALSGRPWQRPVEQALPTSDRGASEAPPLTTDSQWQQSCARPKTSSAPLEHAAVESTTENQANVMKTALSLIEQCKELAKRKRLVDADTVAAFCVVSPEVANELLQRMQSFGILIHALHRPAWAAATSASPQAERPQEDTLTSAAEATDASPAAESAAYQSHDFHWQKNPSS
ncbi:hypothetical protein Esti_003115 [Eimeria stiedai]